MLRGSWQPQYQIYRRFMSLCILYFNSSPRNERAFFQLFTVADENFKFLSASASTPGTRALTKQWTRCTTKPNNPHDFELLHLFSLYSKLILFYSSPHQYSSWLLIYWRHNYKRGKYKGITVLKYYRILFARFLIFFKTIIWCQKRQKLD